MRPLARVPVRHRVVAAFALGSVAVSAVVAVATWNLTTGYMLQQREQSVGRQTLVNARLLDTRLTSGSSDLGALLTGLASSPGAAIFVRQPDGWIAGGTATDNIDVADMPPALIAAADRGDIARQRLRSAARRWSWWQCSCPTPGPRTSRCSRCATWTGSSGSSA
jgi:two-component system sensor histidine kinase MtrB